MACLTDRKRAAGLGSAKEGTNHHIQMMISAVALVILKPLFLITFGSGPLAVGLPILLSLCSSTGNALPSRRVSDGD